jgi:hypothetical protein
MRGLRGLGIVVLIASGVGLLRTTTAFAAGCEVSFSQASTGSTCEGRLGWSYDPAAHTFGYGSVIASAKAKANDPYEYSEDFACEANSTKPGSVIGCTRAFDCPPKLDPDGKPMPATRIMAYRRLRAHPNDPWERTNTGVCKYTGTTVPMAKVVDAARQSIEKQVGRPSIIAQPPNGVTLVNFTSLFHAPFQEVTKLTITEPVPGAITATPHYTWDLGDGITAEGVGHPYDQRFDPSKPESDGYYVKAFYRTPGPKKVLLTLTWQASIHLEDFGDVPLDPIVFTTDTTTTAKTAHARLVAP